MLMVASIYMNFQLEWDLIVDSNQINPHLN